MKTRYDIILMDADETLFDYVKSARASLNATLTKYAIPHDDSTWDTYRELNNALWRKFERGEITKPKLQTERFDALFEVLGAKVDSADFNRDYMLGLAEGGYALPGAEELCQALYPHVKLYIITNGFQFTQERRIERSPLKPYITKMYISEQIGAQKPQKEFFDAVLADLGEVDRSRILVFGDSLTSDMQGGVNAGLDTCWYNPEGKDPAGLHLNYEIAELMELVPIVLEA